MPRDGSNVYHRPPGIDAVTNTTISSTAYNLNVQDVETDLNTPRPIVAGGTGATTAAGAINALGGELAKQIVTNFDAMTWQAGSFYAASTASGAPVINHAFAGIAYYANATDFVVEATDLTDSLHLQYKRVQSAGVWGSWALDQAGQYVKLAGDTMTGTLNINHPTSISTLALSPVNASAQIVLNKKASTQQNLIFGQTNALMRWLIVLGNASAESGSNAGSDFAIYRANDAGTAIDAPLTINRADGSAVFNDNLSVKPAAITSGVGGTTGTYYFGNTGTKYLTYDGTSYSLNGGNLNAGSNINAAGNLTTSSAVVVGNGNSTAIIYFTAVANNKYLYFDGANFSLSGGLTSTGNINGQAISSSNGQVISNPPSGNPAFYWQVNGTNRAYGAYNDTNKTLQFTNFAGGDGYSLGLLQNNVVLLGHGFSGIQGTTGATYGSTHNFYYTGGVIQAWVDASYLGNISLTSDYRTKKDVVDLPDMWSTVKALRPIKYTQAQFTPPAQIAANAEALRVSDEAKARARTEGTEEPVDPIIPPMPMFEADEIERWGFIAHELQATLVESAATGVKDSHDTVQSPNPWTVIAALTKALQEAMARIEALEAR